MKRDSVSIINGKYYPLVSICTPTYNRRPFIPFMMKCFLNQTYPRHRMEWIIVDDGTDRIKDLVESSNITQIKYFESKQKMKLGQKRNFMHSKCNGSIIVYMDDDDYYPPERVEHAVVMLTLNKDALCAGSSEIYIYFKHISKMYQFGPYGPNHATAGTFAFKRELLNITKYDDNASLAEERSFLKDYTIPFVQLDPLKTILVFSHIHNTFDKKRLLENEGENTYCQISDKTIQHFIKSQSENDLIQFFMKDIDGLLEDYIYGYPLYKPDVLRQMKELEEERNKTQLEFLEKSKSQSVSITDKTTGQIFTLDQFLKFFYLQKEKIKQLETEIQSLQQKLLDNNIQIMQAQSNTYVMTSVQNDSQTNDKLNPSILPKTNISD